MKMSKVISELQKRIDFYGDSELVFLNYDDSFGDNVLSVYYDYYRGVGVVSNCPDIFAITPEEAADQKAQAEKAPAKEHPAPQTPRLERCAPGTMTMTWDDCVWLCSNCTHADTVENDGRYEVRRKDVDFFDYCLFCPVKHYEDSITEAAAEAACS